jgi:hypothetical protein
MLKECLRRQDMLDPLLRNKEGLNAADVARKYHFTELEDYLLQKVKIDILIPAGQYIFWFS